MLLSLYILSLAKTFIAAELFFWLYQNVLEVQNKWKNEIKNVLIWSVKEHNQVQASYACYLNAFCPKQIEVRFKLSLLIFPPTNGNNMYWIL